MYPKLNQGKPVKKYPLKNSRNIHSEGATKRREIHSLLILLCSFTKTKPNIEGNIDIYINERDYKVIESNKNIKNEIEKLSIKADKELNHGEIELKVNGITIRKTIK